MGKKRYKVREEQSTGESCLAWGSPTRPEEGWLVHSSQVAFCPDLGCSTGPGADDPGENFLPASFIFHTDHQDRLEKGGKEERKQHRHDPGGDERQSGDQKTFFSSFCLQSQVTEWKREM